MDGNIIDVRSESKLSDRAAPHTRMRDPNNVYAVVLHQMAFSRGNNYRRYLRTTAHYIVLPDGKVYQLHGHEVRLPAANGFNSGSVSVEFAGNFPKRTDSTNPNDWWYPKGKEGRASLQNYPTAPQLRAGRMLLKKLHAQGFTHVLAHAQSTSKGNDPGPDVWGAVGEWGVRTLGMSDGGDGFAIGSGGPIKDHWREAFHTWNDRL